MVSTERVVGSCSLPAREKGGVIARVLCCKNGRAGRGTRSICISGEKRVLECSSVV